MAIDRKYIFDKANFFLKKENKFFTSSELHLAIGVDAFRRVSQDLEFPKSNYSSVLASGVYTLAMPSDFVKVDKTKDVVFTDSSRTRNLPPRDQRRIGRDQILTATPGNPTNYFMEDQTTIGVYPPSTSGIIVVPYVQQATSLSSDSATNQLTDKAYMAATYWVVAECMLKDNDARFDTYAKLYTGEILRLRKELGELYEETKDFYPDAEYTRR